MNTIEIIPKMISLRKEEYLQTKILIDRKPLVYFRSYAINYRELVRSTEKNGEYRIITCHCGVDECAGIRRGIQVRFIENYVEWSFPDLYPTEEIFTFDNILYVKAIQVGFEKAKDLYEKAISKGKKFIRWSRDRVSGQKMFYSLPLGENFFLSPRWDNIVPRNYTE